MIIVPGKCPICSSSAKVEDFAERTTVVCPRCGNFSITSTARKSIPQPSAEEIPKISGWIRERQGITIRSEDVPRLNELRMPSVGEKAEKILLWLERRCPIPGALIIPQGTEHAEIEGIGWTSDDAEAVFLLRDYLTDEKQYIRPAPPGQSLWQGIYITPKGWSYLDSLRRGNSQSVIGFVAMSFHPSMDTASEAIQQGIRAAGYTPLRIDQHLHNNKIDDEIIAGIRRSKFLVADFTGQRGGVYFEAGFAKGLGLEVIWLCRQDDLEKLHFDTRQYSHIPWREAKLPELTTALKNRIEATIGRGPIT